MDETNAEFVKRRREAIADMINLSEVADLVVKDLLDAIARLEGAEAKIEQLERIIVEAKACVKISQDKIEQLEIRLEESRKLGRVHKNRELANAKKCSEYYEQIKKLQAKISEPIHAYQRQLEKRQQEIADAEKLTPKEEPGLSETPVIDDMKVGTPLEPDDA